MSRHVSFLSEYKNTSTDDIASPADGDIHTTPVLKLTINNKSYSFKILSEKVDTWNNKKMPLDGWEDATVKYLTVDPMNQFSLFFIPSIYSKVDNFVHPIEILFSKHNIRNIILIQCVGYDNTDVFVMFGDHLILDVDYYMITT